jgi:hypothetical protein
MIKKKFFSLISSSLANVIVTDIDDDLEEIKFKILRIAEIFDQSYKENLQEFYVNIGPFRNFGDILIRMNLAEKNCGGGSGYEGCTHNEESIEIGKIF